MLTEGETSLVPGGVAVGKGVLAVGGVGGHASPPSYGDVMPRVSVTNRMAAANGGIVSGSGLAAAEENTIFGNATLSFGAAVDSVEGEKSPTHIKPHPSSSSSSSHLTLYEHLAEVMGEGLTLSLAVPAHMGVTESGPTHKPPPPLKSPTTDATSLNQDAIKHVTRSLEGFLSKEGFRPVRVPLPQRAPPPPSIPRGYYQGRDPVTFSVPQSLLPVQGNVLEQLERGRGKGRGNQFSQQGHGGIVKGVWPGHRRHYITKQPSNCPVDMSSLWL